MVNEEEEEETTTVQTVELNEREVVVHLLETVLKKILCNHFIIYYNLCFYKQVRLKPVVQSRVVKGRVLQGGGGEDHGRAI